MWEVLPLLECLLGLMEDGRATLEASGQGTSPLAVAHQNAWEKLNKYYNKTDSSHEIYAASTLLHPGHRKAYFDDQWTSKESRALKTKMITNIKKVWEEEYRGQIPSMPEQPQEEEDILDRHYKKPRLAASADPFTTFITGSKVEFAKGNDAGLITWWMRPENEALRQMALDLISIPAMSVEVERLFSSAKRLITPDRNRLNDETIEMLQLLKYWWDNELTGPVLQQQASRGRHDYRDLGLLN